MPRKASKTAKPPLLFLERSLCGARLQNVPEVRAALNPREFFTETHEHDSSSRISWVSPQFDSTHVAVPPPRRGRGRKCQSAASILDTSTQFSRKTSVCKYPSLSFHTRTRDQSQQPRNTRSKRASNSTAAAPNVGNPAQGSCQIKKTVSSGPCLETPKRPLDTIRKRSVERVSDAAVSSNRCSDEPKTPSVEVTERCVVPADGASVLALNDFSTTEVSSISLPPDVDTPKVIQDGLSCSSSTSVHLLLPPMCTPTCSQSPDVLVTDTPERDYGVKVTWRRRRGLMLLLKQRGHLMDSDVLICS